MPIPSNPRVAFQEIVETHVRIGRFVRRTPVITCESLRRQIGTDTFFKCENLQRSGSFKLRGATSAVSSLAPEVRTRGVVTHSSGNFAQALALSARDHGSTPAYIVMPEGSNRSKVEAVADFGAQTTFCPNTLEARERTAESVRLSTGAAFIHPFNDPRVIYGQATAAKELLEDLPNLDTIVAPLGGGGLLSGTAIAAAAMAPGARIIGVEPELADDGRASFLADRIQPPKPPLTIADGLRTGLGDLTFALIRQYVSDVVTVSEAAIVEAMRLFWTRTKLVIEPSSAVVVAALLENKIKGRRIGVIISGGNVDLDDLPWTKPDLRSSNRG